MFFFFFWRPPGGFSWVEETIKNMTNDRIWRLKSLIATDKGECGYMKADMAELAKQRQFST